MRVKVYLEVGFGNPTWISTEREYPDGTEERGPGVCRMRPKGLYLRIWSGRTVVVLSTRDGFKRQGKTRRDFKIVLGVEGVGEEVGSRTGGRAGVEGGDLL